MEEYFRYLYDLLEDRGWWYVGYETVARIMLDIPFVSAVANDDNRAMDGLEIREEYGKYIPDICEECTMLEMIVALCGRIKWEMTDEFEHNSIGKWFSIIMDNLGIEEGCEDEEFIITTLLNARDRQYDYSGNGGFFPLKWAQEDQRDVEIWYQMQEFLIENY